MKNEKDFDVTSELNKEMGNPDKTDNRAGNMKSILKQVFFPTSSTDNRLINASDAYLRATYKEYTSHKKLFHSLVQRIKDRIKARMEQNTLYAFVEIEPETMNYAEEIAKSLREYGYQVWTIGKKELENLCPDTKVNKTTMFLLIMWDKVYE